ncbi:MAG: 3-oxo-5-alpha-steroid 4-dehydrogenase, partial [Brevinema sp.]
FAFFLWTVANLLPRALTSHRWYLDHFPDYPKDRKALIPFLL